VVFFPLKGEKRYRIVGIFPEEFNKGEGDILYEEIEERIKTETKLDLDIHDVEWFSNYKVHVRHVNRFNADRRLSPAIPPTFTPPLARRE
jgi:hypothetical protein